MCGSRGGQGIWILPLKNHNNIGFSSNTGLDPLKNHKATKPARHLHASATPFKWRFAGGQMAFRWRTVDGPAYSLVNAFWNRVWHASPCSCVDWFENYMTANPEDIFFAAWPNYVFCLLTITSLTLCMLSQFSCLFCRLLVYFIIIFFKTTFSNIVRVSNSLGMC